MNNSDLGLPIPLGPFASFQNATISKQVFLPDLTAGDTYNLDLYAVFGYTINTVYQINGVNITGLSSISVDSTPQNVTATGANTVSVGDTLSLVFSSASSPENIQFTLAATRTS
jgi:hypothetical protein